MFQSPFCFPVVLGATARPFTRAVVRDGCSLTCGQEPLLAITKELHFSLGECKWIHCSGHFALGRSTGIQPWVQATGNCWRCEEEHGFKTPLNHRLAGSRAYKLPSCQPALNANTSAPKCCEYVLYLYMTVHTYMQHLMHARTKRRQTVQVTSIKTIQQLRLKARKIILLNACSTGNHQTTTCPPLFSCKDQLLLLLPDKGVAAADAATFNLSQDMRASLKKINAVYRFNR